MYSFTYADSRQYTPEAKDAMNVMTASVKRVVSHIGKVNDNALGFYGISRRQRDLFCNTRYHISGDMPCGLNMAINPVNFESKKLKLNCGEEIVYLPDELVDKTICHEFGHTLAPLSTFLNHTKLALWTRSAPYILMTGGSLLGGLGSESSEAGAAMGACLGAYIGRYIGIVTQYPLRMEEFRCDDVADRMMPEITYGEKADVFAEVSAPRTDGDKDQRLRDRVLKFMNVKKEALGEQLENRIVLQKLQYLHKTHPSYYSRYKRSDKVCPLYLEEKKRLKIPSLIKG